LMKFSEARRAVFFSARWKAEKGSERNERLSPPISKLLPPLLGLLSLSLPPQNGDAEGAESPSIHQESSWIREGRSAKHVAANSGPEVDVGDAAERDEPNRLLHDVEFEFWLEVSVP